MGITHTLTTDRKTSLDYNGNSPGLFSRGKKKTENPLKKVHTNSI